jgi:hypothetical protein
LLVVDLDQPKPGAAVPPYWQSIGGVADGSDVLAVLAEHAGRPFPADTYTVHTGRGGTHLYFARPAAIRLGNSAGDRGGLGWLIDSRGGGGYIVAAGSTVDGRPYTWRTRRGRGWRRSVRVREFRAVRWLELRRTETRSETGPAPQAPPDGSALAFALVRGAEDKGFEPLRGCPQHAFQACALGH